jgi:CubicO group peptidase (beta-lactamase class C family)
MSNVAWWDRVLDELNTYQVANPVNLPGAVFAAETQHDGRLVANVGDDWTNTTICNIGSMCKAFIGAAVLLALEEDGRVDIETPVWKLPGMEPYANDPLKRQIRVRHLLQQTSGLPNLMHRLDFPVSPCNDRRDGPPCSHDGDLYLGPTVPWIGAAGTTNECVFADGRCQPARQLNLEKVSRHVMETYPLLHQPGAQYTYSTSNYVVAARIIEELTGKSVNIYIKEKLLAPLGLSSSFFIAQKTGDPIVDARLDEGVTEEQRARIADVSVITQDGELPPEVAPGPDGRTWDKFRRGWRYVYPDAGMYSTADDLLTFLGMLRDGGVYQSRRILSTEVLRLLVEDQGFGHTMGFGYRRQTTPYGQGPGTLEHMGNMMTYFWYDPDPGNSLLGVFLSQRICNVAVNNNMSDGMRVIFRLFVPLVKGGVYGLPPSRPIEVATIA